MSREQYARGLAYSPDGDIECHPGVELREGDDVDAMTHSIQDMAAHALRIWGGNHMEVVRMVEELIKSTWPGRAYFIETEEAGRGVQVYEPWR